MRHDEYPDMSVSLVVDGEALDEYDDDADGFEDPNTVSAYVEATSGAKFGVKLRTTQNFARHSDDRIAWYLYMDGKHVRGLVSRSLDSSNTDIMDSLISNTNRGVVRQKFAFAQLQTHDGPLGDTKKRDFKHLGEITVRCIWVRQTSRAKACPVTNSLDPADGDIIPEKCLKGRAIGNRATLGKARYQSGAAPATFVDVSYPYSKAPFAEFTFKYRSRRDLQIEGIIPRSPSPVPLEERNADDLSPEEARELVRILRAREEDQVRVKRENMKRERETTITGDDSDIEETAAGPTERRRTSDDSGIEIIDLTDA